MTHSVDSVLYGLPSRPGVLGEPPLTGAQVQVSEWQVPVSVWQQGGWVNAFALSGYETDSHRVSAFSGWHPFRVGNRRKYRDHA